MYCTGTEALYRLYGQQGEYRYSCTVQALRLCTGRTAHKGEWRYSCTVLAVQPIVGVEVQLSCTGTEALYRPYFAQGDRGIPLLFLNHGTRSGEVSASGPGRSLPPVKARYPLHRKLGGSQGRFGRVRKILTPPGFDPRTVKPVANRYTD